MDRISLGGRGLKNMIQCRHFTIEMQINAIKAHETMGAITHHQTKQLTIKYNKSIYMLVCFLFVSLEVWMGVCACAIAYICPPRADPVYILKYV